MHSERDAKPVYYCIALACLMGLVVFTLDAALTPPKPKTSKQTKAAIATLDERTLTLEAKLRELEAAK